MLCKNPTEMSSDILHRFLMQARLVTIMPIFLCGRCYFPHQMYIFLNGSKFGGWGGTVLGGGFLYAKSRNPRNIGSGII